MEDAYVRRQRAGSILCLPLVKQGKLIGVLCLEDNLASQVFTTKRLVMLEPLASQAAIALHNARLYAELTQENIERRRAEKKLHQKEVFCARPHWLMLAGVTTMGELAASIAYEVNQPLAGIVTNANATLR